MNLAIDKLRSPQAGGLPDGSRGLRSAATIPPEHAPPILRTLKGHKNRYASGDARTPSGCKPFSRTIRGYRCAQPPATFFQPSGLIPAASPERQEPVERLVDRILAAKQQDAEADVSALKREIDELAFALYGLTLEEIKLVEESAQKK